MPYEVSAAELDSILLEFLDRSKKLLLCTQLPRAHIALNDIGLAPPEIIFVLKPHDKRSTSPPLFLQKRLETMILRNSLLRQSQYYLSVITRSKGGLNCLQFGAHHRSIDHSVVLEDIGTEEPLYVRGRGARWSNIDGGRGR